MVTRLFFYNETYSGLDFPTGNQHPSLTPTAGKSFDDWDIAPRSMGLDLPDTAHMNSLITSNATTAQQTFFYHRFMSPPLALSGGITAQTWTFNFAVWISNLSSNFPVSGNDKTIPINCYVWRPGVGKVGTILAGNSNADFDEPTAASAYRSVIGTFNGAAVNNLQDGDCIVFEVWFQVTQSSATAYGDYFMIDGSTVTLTTNTTVTNHATFIETPQDISIYTPPATIQMTNEWTKTLNTKFITSV